MTITTTAAPSAQKAVTDDAATDLANRRLSIAFINWAHAIDHFVILIYPTVVIALQAIYGDSYSTLIYSRPPPLSPSACFRCRPAGSAITGAGAI